MKQSDRGRGDADILLVSMLAVCASLIAFVVYARRGDLLLAGDAVAHINIARRVFDSRTPGLLQLGTVWLPLPHLLMVPFVVSDWAWQTGAGGAIPSMLAYILATAGIFRLVRDALQSSGFDSSIARVAAFLGTVAFAANPNLLYVQTTALTETISLAASIWAVVYFADFQRALAQGVDSSGINKAVRNCGVFVAMSAATRYDGWFLTGVVICSVLGVAWQKQKVSELRISLAKFVLISAAVPVLWIAYNAIVYRNPLEFSSGPYSARAIEAKSGAGSHPGAGNLAVATLYFFKAAKLNTGEGPWGAAWAICLLVGFAGMLIFPGSIRSLLLLAVPLPFYALAIAYSAVPLYVPQWWPYGYYNVRYGLELLPAFAAGIALLFALGLRASRGRWKLVPPIAAAILIVGAYGSIWRSQPICYQEAWLNSRGRIALESELGKTLRRLPANSTILMYLGDHVGALQYAGIPLQRTINEGNHRVWKQPSDPQGIWERALADPARNADYVVAVADDPVATHANLAGLTAIAVVHARGQKTATLYVARGNQTR